MPISFQFLMGFLIITFVMKAEAQHCLDSSQCRSQLLRLEVANNALEDGAAESLLPSLQAFAHSPTLTNIIQNQFQIKTLPFPPNGEVCRREQEEGDPAFRNVDCNSRDLCSNTSLNAAARERICFRLPCPMLEGTLNSGKCDQVENIYPTQISFPTALEIQNISLNPTSVSYENKQAKICFRIDRLDLTMSTRLSLDTTGTELPDNFIQVDNINPHLDAPREACVEATMDLTSSNPVSNMKITYPNPPFITDQMIRSAAAGLRISGLSGYPADALATVQSEVAPALFHPLRESIESGVRDGLEQVFEEELQKIVSPITSARNGTSSFINSRNFMSELGYGNMGISRAIDTAECTLIRARGKEIPRGHSCLGIKDEEGNPRQYNTNSFNTPFFALGSLRDVTSHKDITSESFKQRLIALQEQIRQLPPEPAEGAESERETEWRLSSHARWIEREVGDLQKIIDRITQAQLGSRLFDFVEIQNQLRGNQASNIGLSLPEICDEVRPSPHAGREMRGCPIQIYADLSEFNQLLTRMWESGRMCMTGRGPFVASKDENGNDVYNSEGAQLGSGCQLEMGGMRCFIKSPPQIRYDGGGRNYKMSIGLEKCFRGPVILGQGRFGGDINIDVGFQPQACEGGDFCMNNPKATWNVVPGTERYAMRESSRLHDMVTNGINSGLNGALGDTIRLPLANALGGVPLRAEGRVDSGPGFFGVCLELQNGNTP